MAGELWECSAVGEGDGSKEGWMEGLTLQQSIRKVSVRTTDSFMTEDFRVQWGWPCCAWTIGGELLVTSVVSVRIC